MDGSPEDEVTRPPEERDLIVLARELNRLGVGCLRDLGPNRSLPDEQERLHKLAFTANGHSGKTFVPLAHGNFGFLIEPRCKQAELPRGNAARAYAVEEMLE